MLNVFGIFLTDVCFYFTAKGKLEGQKQLTFLIFCIWVPVPNCHSLALQQHLLQSLLVVPCWETHTRICLPSAPATSLILFTCSLPLCIPKHPTKDVITSSNQCCFLKSEGPSCLQTGRSFHLSASTTKWLMQRRVGLCWTLSHLI